jgi:hypothetical protein
MATLQTVKTPQQLQQEAEAQVGGEIDQAIAPLNSQLGQIGANQSGAAQNLDKLFGNILPYVQASAGAVSDAHKAAQESEQAIFQAAQGNLANLARQRAQEAQTLAQQIGGPIAAGTFTEGVTPAQQYFAQVGSGQLMHGLAMGEAGTELAQSFAGKVFPLVKTEQAAQLTNMFEAQKKEIQDQIAQLAGGKGKAVNARLADLQAKEREYQLSVVQQNLDKVKAAHDWTATKRTLANDDARLKIAQGEAANQRAQLTGKIGGKPTQQAKELTANIAHMTAQDKATARQLGLSEKEFAARQVEALAKGKEAKTRLDLQMQQMAMQIIDSATNPEAGASITQTVPTEVTASTAALNKAAYAQTDANGKIHYFLDRKVTLPGASSVPVQDPQKLYEMLRGYKVPQAMAIKLVKSKMGTPQWVPGKKDYDAKQLNSMPFSQMRGIAIALGFKPDPKAPKTRKQIVNFILQARK